MAVLWHVIRSKPNREEFLQEQLESRNFKVYNPCLIVRPVNPRSRTRKSLFPGYLFIQIDIIEVSPGVIARIPGAANLVAFGGEIAYVPENIVHAIQSKVEQLNFSGNAQHGLNPGDQVRIEKGPFEGYEGILDLHASGADRVKVLLKMLQRRNLTVEMPVDYVQKK